MTASTIVRSLTDAETSASFKAEYDVSSRDDEIEAMERRRYEVVIHHVRILMTELNYLATV